MGLRRRGLGYEANHGGILLHLDRLRESRGELSGELTVRVDGEHLSRGRVNLSSLSARASLVKLLHARTPNAAIEWAGILEAFDVGVLTEERRGEPFSQVGQQPRSRAGDDMLLDPILAKSKGTTIFGGGGMGKTTVAAAIACSLAAGRVVIPNWVPPATPTPGLILDWESSEADWNELVAGIAAGARMTPPAIAYRRQHRPLVDDLEVIAAEAEKIGAQWLIVDSVGLAAGTVREGGDASESALRMYAALRALNLAALLVDHVAGDQLGNDGATAKPYGSVYKVNLARSVFELRREKDATDDRSELLLVHTKVNRGAKQKPLGLAVTYGENGAITFERTEVQAPELVKVLGHPERLARLLVSGPLSPPVIAEELGISAGHLRSIVSKDGGRRFQRLTDQRVGLAPNA